MSTYEGKIVVLSYTECDYNDEFTAALVYKVSDGKLDPLLGVMDLHDGTSWNYDEENYDQALALIVAEGATEVLVPSMVSERKHKFFGSGLGFTAMSGVNDQNEIECWCEFSNFVTEGSDFLDQLQKNGITVLWINPETMEVEK